MCAMATLELILGSCLALLISLSSVASSSSRDLGELPTDRPLIVAHRGSSGQLPEHTVEAYRLAVEQGADVIECDLAVTKDLQMICTHEPWLNHTTDVHSRSEFANRATRYFVSSEGRFITDYFTIDFTLEELKTLRKIQPRSYRDQSYNGKLAMASLEECIAVAQNSSNRKTVGIYPETKVPDFFNNFLKPNSTTIEDILLEIMEKYGYKNKNSPAFLQSFDIRSLQYMTNHTDLRLVFLTGTAIPDAQLETMSSYVSGIGPSKSAIVRVNPATNTISSTTDFIERAHKYGFTVHPYTFRNEYQFLAYDYGADPYKEYEMFFKLGVDGLFTDFPASMANYLGLIAVDDLECPTDGTVHTSYNLLMLSVTVMSLITMVVLP